MSNPSVTHERARDCRVPKADTPTYHVKVDGEWTIQNRMFSRADMAFWEFGAADVAPPTGSTLEFWSTGEPHFEPREVEEPDYDDGYERADYPTAQEEEE